MKAYIQPNMVQWARERSNLSLANVATTTAVKSSQVADWEEGSDQPTIRQAQKLANALHIPLGWLYLKPPPKERLAIPDLRTIGSEDHGELSPNFRDLLNDVLYKQGNFADLIKEEGAEPLPFIGKFTIRHGVKKVAEDIRNALDVTDQMRQGARNSDEFLRQLIHHAEEAGILVMRSGIVGSNTHRALSVEEFRGFAISDAYAPLVFLNSKDAPAAQIFTLAHELAHLWVGASGISNQRMNAMGNNTHTIEPFCNKVAAEVLVPENRFYAVWDTQRLLEENLTETAKHFKVSRLVIIFRALNLGDMSQQEFKTLFAQEMAIQQHRKKLQKQSEGGPSQKRLVTARNGHLLTETILAATYEGRVLFRDACQILGTKIPTIEKLAIEAGVL